MSVQFRARKAFPSFRYDTQWTADNGITVLFGASGAGKSLTLNLLAGLATPDEGRIVMGGRVLFDPEERVDVPVPQRSVGYVIQNLALFPHMTVEQNIGYGAPGLARDERRDRVRDMLREFRLTGLERKYPHEVSGGQKQRVAFARALVRRPEALLLDEPFSSLDTPLRREMRRFLLDLRREFPIPVVLVTHDLAEALLLADTLVLLAGGRVLQAGTPSRLLEAAESEEVRRLLQPGTGDTD